MSTVLLAIDETHVASRLMSTFRDAGYTVACVTNGVEAYRSARHIRPDIVIADYRLAQMGGLELCTKLRNDRSTRDIPVVLLTARGFGNPAASNLPNIRRVLTKPVGPNSLLDLVRQLLRRTAAATGVA